jgi:integrase
LYGWTYRRNQPPIVKDHVDPFTREEQNLIISTAAGQIRNQIVTFFWTGMRTSELIALEWSDVDWKRKKIRISKALTYAAKQDETTKTRAGNREIDILPPVERALTDQKAFTLLQGGKVFHHPNTGKPWIGDQSLRKAAWLNIMNKAGVRYRNPYQTRHTYASMMLSAGENPAWVSSQMGHSNIMITLRIYARWIPNKDKQGTKALEMFGQHLVNIKE